MIGLFVLLSIPKLIANPQDIPNLSQDYQIVSTSNVLKNILNNPDANLTYEGAERDIENINQVTPVSLLEEYGIMGYRIHNSEEGRNINDSGIGGKTYADYMDSFIRLSLHNPYPFIKQKLYNYQQSIAAPQMISLYSFEGESYNGDIKSLFSDLSAEWETGRINLSKNQFVWLSGNPNIEPKRQALASTIKNLYDLYCYKLQRFSWIRRLAVPFLVFIIALIKLNRKKDWFYFFVGAILIAELAAIILLSPEGRAYYYYPVTNLMNLYIIIGILRPKPKSNMNLSIT